MTTLERHGSQLDDSLEEQVELRIRFSHLFPGVDFDTVPEAGLISKFASNYDFFLEGALLRKLESVAHQGGQFLERINIRYRDDLHLFHQVIAVAPLEARLALPKAVLSLVKPEETVGGAGYEDINGIKLLVVGVTIPDKASAHEKPAAFIWYRQSTIAIPNRTRET